MDQSTRPEWMGYTAAIFVVFVWATWLIVSRASAGSGLTVYDLAAFRYGLAAIVALPFVIRYRPWHRLTVGQIAAVSVILGPVYILIVFVGFRLAPAAHGGIFMNGILPILGLIVAYFLMRAWPKRTQVIGSVIIFVAAIVLAGDGALGTSLMVWLGDVCFIIGAVFFAFYVALSRTWALRTSEILFCGTIINAAVYLPIWAIALPSGLAQAPMGPMLLQAVYQGFFPNLAGLLLIAFAARTIGSEKTSAILAAVPAVGAVLGAVVLHEYPTVQGWIAIGFLTIGLLLATVGLRVFGLQRS